MKASELRIGNLVDHYFPDQIEENVTDKIEVCISASDLSDTNLIDSCYGIPLTEEWLVRFGFKISNDCFVKSSGQLDLIIFNSNTPVAKANEVNPGEFYYCFHKVIIKIKYVHQLQNLYFALTGEELTLLK